MKQKRWAQIDELFHSALERKPSERMAFLAEACGTDAALRSEVESLLSAEVAARSFLEGGPKGGEIMLEPGAQLGAYRIGALIGRGGMGEVYRAHDTRLVREVAIKVLPCFSSAPSEQPASEKAAAPDQCEEVFEGLLARDESLRRRFESEALLTARVQHPAVVPVHERGQLPGGQPFYSMKLISGRSLRELIGERKTLAERLALLPNVIAVADALAHAHSLRILHRDVKPSNIIIGEFGETVLIDWGLAKNLAAQAGELQPGAVPDDAARTAVGSIIGTPAYMSPEQARGLPADERADVFSLGATLYHLLAREAPYEGDTPAILPRVAQGEHVPLSEKLSDVPPELAAIVDRAMAREPAKRYPSARELAEDLRRFQTGQLVRSHRYSARELLGRWAKRHRPLLFATAAFVAVAVVSGAIGIRRIVAERDRANREAVASERVSKFMTDMFKVSDPSESRGSSVTAREILDKASEQIEGGLSRDQAVQARLMHTMALVYSRLGLLAKARLLAEKAVKVRRELLGPEHADTLHSMTILGNLERRQGRYAAAAEIHQQVFQIRRRVLGPEHPDTLSSIEDLAIVDQVQGRYAEAEKLHRQAFDVQRRVLGPEHQETLRSMGNLAGVETELGKYAEAESLDRQVLEIMVRVWGADHPDALIAMGNLALIEARSGKYDAAEPLNRQVLETSRRVRGPEHPNTLLAMYNFAENERVLGKYAEAEKIYGELLVARRRVIGAEHPDTLATMSGLGIIYLATRRLPESESIRREVFAVSRRVLGPKHPQTLMSMNYLAEVESALGRHADAEKLCQEALDSQRQVLGPENVETLSTELTMANIYARQGRYDESEKLLRETLAVGRRALGPNHPQVAVSLYSLGKLALRQGDRKKALDYLRNAIDRGLGPGDVKQMREDEELRPLRGDPEFETLIADAQKRSQVQ